MIFSDRWDLSCIDDVGLNSTANSIDWKISCLQMGVDISWHASRPSEGLADSNRVESELSAI